MITAYSAIHLAAIADGTGGFVTRGEDAYDGAGRSVASAGDINGDGFDDLVIGTTSAGAAYVVFGKASVFGAVIDLRAVAQGQGGFVIRGEHSSDFAGGSVASAGDIDGDGFDDLIVGAFGAYGLRFAHFSAGAAYVIFGGGFQPGPAGTEGDDSLSGGVGAQYIQGLRQGHPHRRRRRRPHPGQ